MWKIQGEEEILLKFATLLQWIKIYDTIRIKKGGGISTAKLNDLCEILDCKVEDIIRYEKA